MGVHRHGPGPILRADRTVRSAQGHGPVRSGAVDRVRGPARTATVRRRLLRPGPAQRDRRSNPPAAAGSAQDHAGSRPRRRGRAPAQLPAAGDDDRRPDLGDRRSPGAARAAGRTAGRVAARRASRGVRPRPEPGRRARRPGRDDQPAARRPRRALHRRRPTTPRPDGTDSPTARRPDSPTARRPDGTRVPPPETMRRVVRTLLARQQDHLTDDASLLGIDWRDGAP